MQRHQTDGIVHYTFESLASYPELRHGVTARHGGVSQGRYASLNMSRSWGDDPLAVEENVLRACRAVGVARASLVQPQQRHTANAARVGLAERGSVIANCDILVTDEPGTTLIMRYADCTPILVYDATRHAVALVHSGWRGTVQGAAREAVRALGQAFGSRPQDMVAAIGPSIGPCCYEVGQDVVDAVHGAFAGANGLLVPSGPRPHFDLWTANARWLAEAGVRQVEVSGLCTACHDDEFYSYRAGRGRTGQFAAIIGLVDGA